MIRPAAIALALVASACSDGAAPQTSTTSVVDTAPPGWQVQGFGWLTGWCGGDVDSTCVAEATVDGNLLILRTGGGAGVRTFEGTMEGRGIAALDALGDLATAGKPPEGCGVACDGRTVTLTLVKGDRVRALSWDPWSGREEPWGPAYRTIERMIEGTAACEPGLTVPSPGCEPVPPFEG